MKFHLKNFTPEHYIRYMRRKPKHVQHLHGVAFAGIVTSLIAGVILYTDYGFWHETYQRAPEVDDSVTVETVPLSQSFGNFLKEAKTKFNAIGSVSAELLEGKETYRKDSE